MIDAAHSAQLLLLLLTANGTPILARRILGRHWNQPVDNGYTLGDGRRLFGETKTWRGLVLAMAVTAAVAWLLGFPPLAGALFALIALAGDLVSSFIKRRLGLMPSSRATGLDQLPEAILPLLLMHRQFAVDVATGAMVVAGFFILEILLSKLLYRLHIRKQPY